MALEIEVEPMTREELAASINEAVKKAHADKTVEIDRLRAENKRLLDRLWKIQEIAVCGVEAAR